MEKMGIVLGRALIAAAITCGSYLLMTIHPLWIGEKYFFFFLMHSLDLGIHEAGHFLFFLTRGIGGPNGVGELLYLLGGSLAQWLVPLCCVAYFAYTKQDFAAFAILFWFGQSLHDAVPYIADATTLKLPLLGGHGIHDWNYILFDLGLLHLDKQIAAGLQSCANLVLIVSMVGTWILSITPLLKSSSTSPVPK